MCAVLPFLGWMTVTPQFSYSPWGRAGDQHSQIALPLADVCIGICKINKYLNSCSGDFWEKLCFARRRTRNLELRNGSLYASTQKVHRPRSQSPLLFVLKTYSKFARKICFSSARRLLPAALFEHWPQVCRDRTTFAFPPTNCLVSTIMNSPI